MGTDRVLPSHTFVGSIGCMDSSIIIVSWNVRDQLKRCLESVFNSAGLTFEVIVIDNASSDGSAQMVAEIFPDVRLIRNHRNAGFARACNQGIKQSTGETILLLNPDTIVQSHTIRSSVDFLHQTPDAGIVGCRIQFPDGRIQPSVRRFPDIVSHSLMLLKIHNFFPRLKPLQKYYAWDFDYEKTQPVEQVMGAYYLIRRSLIDAIGMFDEDFYIWYEEVDYCYRARAHGWKTYYLSTTTIVHEKGASFKQRPPLRLQIIMGKSMLHYFRKHAGWPSVAILSLFFCCSLLLSSIQTIFGIQKKRHEL